MGEKDLIDLIFSLRDDIWQNWGFLITVNLAVWGWLLKRHGLFSQSEKCIATIGYTVFVCLLLYGFDKVYMELDAAANELAYKYSSDNSKTVTESGIIEKLVSNSPKYCEAIKRKNTFLICGKYSSHFWFVLYGVLAGWLFTIVLFWYDAMWIKSRQSSSQ